jgi:membrane protease YdiL (CAAX protease family)
VPDAASERTPPPPPTRRRVAVEIAASFALASAVAAALYRVDLVRNYYSAIVAGLLLYIPAWVLRRHALADYGLTLRPAGRSLLAFGAMSLLVFPVFTEGYVLWQGFACSHRTFAALAPGPCYTAPMWSRFHPRLPADAIEFILGHLVVVALPEEFFFRGFVQGRLAEVWSSRKILGAPVGPVVLASALFALCHLVMQANPATLFVFFPGLLFGWLRARTGSLFAGTLFHAACNIYIETLHASFFP